MRSTVILSFALSERFLVELVSHQSHSKFGVSTRSVMGVPFGAYKTLAWPNAQRSVRSPASSLSSCHKRSVKRVRSTAGSVITERGARLSDEKLGVIVFLHDNFDLCLAAAEEAQRSL